MSADVHHLHDCLILHAEKLGYVLAVHYPVVVQDCEHLVMTRENAAVFLSLTVGLNQFIR